MAENMPPSEKSDSSQNTSHGEFEQLQLLVVQQWRAMKQSFEDIAKQQNVVNMKINAVEMRLNATIAEMRLYIEKEPPFQATPFQAAQTANAAQIMSGFQQSLQQAAQILKGIQQTVIKKDEDKKEKPE